jgi:serine protease Do
MTKTTQLTPVAAWLFAAATAALAFAPPAAGQAKGQFLPDFTELYERQSPAVVSIDVTQKVRRGRLADLSEDDPFYEFFRRFGQVPRRGLPEREPESQAVGSGFLISSDGYLITNAHVVEGADEVKVNMADRREFKAKVIGADKRTDIALLKIEGKDFPRVAVGDPEKLKVGEWVVAIGKPFGLENTMTAGIVSAKGRDLPQENLVPFLQTDVAINPGNSGGPLFNLKGEVVGVNSLIFSRSGGYMGLAFAIPIDVAMSTATQLKEKGKVTRGRIGVQIQEVTKELAEAFGLQKAGGALVNNVEKGGPADKAGVEADDVIVKVDNRDVRSSTELPRIITTIRPGTKITLGVWRKGQMKDLTVVVAEMPDDTVASAQPRRTPPQKERAKPNRMGLSLTDLTDEQKKELDVKNGVLIEDIAPGVRAGNIQPGDVIVAIINRGTTTEAKSAEQVNSLLSKVEKGASVALKLRRGEQQFIASIRPNAAE